MGSRDPSTLPRQHQGCRITLPGVPFYMGVEDFINQVIFLAPQKPFENRGGTVSIHQLPYLLSFYLTLPVLPCEAGTGFHSRFWG